MSGNLKSYELNEIKEVKIYGRRDEKINPIAFFWTGSGFEANVKASELWMNVEVDYDVFEQWISVEINGEIMARTMLNKGRYDVCLFRGMNKDNVKNVRVYKEVQPMPGDDKNMLIIHSLKTDGEFEEVPEKRMKLEFIGDSITSGEGSIGAKKETDWISMFFTAHRNYALLTAKELDADFRIISQSGWGTACAWNNDPNCTLPKYYEKVCGVINGERNEKLGAHEDNDFKSWKPDVIVVNLGTNDDAAFYNDEYVDEKTGERFKMHKNEDGSYNKQDVSIFENAVINFLVKLRKYNSESKIIWAYGMIGIPMMEFIYNAVSTYKNEFHDSKVWVTQLPNVTDETVGAKMHPGVLAHKESAKVLAELIKNL